ncbi:inositol-hexakisphosphate/diphosphoinositol-pentakisphosphate 1-kinase [Nematocida major]|uniref:inositol-hexakisphosphate/diphosphoinositol- pentakisphosphate 1-kinase n=1 Tax=Nematocida major TaxID=1912982 RepID=UPI0020086705|nr:inositol-hexakisphosphate/diphosphoinositol-pentakisphosphate 1-kinase [Nematocida major]KAH9385383.1 inositol-hexakisphosphate/diphosphoinositol-pentakisphosphate 1-kinase [Nematocida major]
MLIPFIEQIHIGVFIPNRKLHTEPMKQLGEYLKRKGYSIYYFEDAYRDETPVDSWPHVDVMLTFFSEGIDFMKIRTYASIHKPFEVNAIDRQFLLLDRRSVMAVLDKIKVPTAERIVYNGSIRKKGSAYAPPASTADLVKTPNNPNQNQNQKSQDISVEKEIEEIVRKQLEVFNIRRDDLFQGSSPRSCHEDTLSVGSARMEKPYVEKPVYSEDHNIHIYYSSKCEGRENGICRLFRKIGSKSSNFDRNTQGTSYREDGSFIYEKFLPIKDYLDIKVYVLGKTVYAETRKSPVKDGIVIRTESGKEERKEIALTPLEVSAVLSVSKALGQFICGMDILRTSNEKFIVVDVNGWSFVKSNVKYYTQAHLKHLDKKIKRHVLKGRAKSGDTSRREDVLLYGKVLEAVVSDAGGKGEVSARDVEIKGVHSVYRHARRTPKLKKKLSFASERLLEYAGRASHMAGRDTSKVKELERILGEESAGNAKFATHGNLHALKALKEITKENSDVRAKLSIDGESVRVVLKWGGALTERSRKEIEYEAMEYESFLSTVEGDSFSNYAIYAPNKPVSERKTERKVRILANPEDRTLKTAEIFKTVLGWTERSGHSIKEKYFCISRDADDHADISCPRLASAYSMMKESFLCGESSKISVEPLLGAPLENEYSCADGEREISLLYRNKLTIKAEKGLEKAERGSGGCKCADSACECAEIGFLRRWCFVFNEYPLLTLRNTKTVIPLLLDLIDYDILSSQYERKRSPIFKYFPCIEEVFALFNAHASLLYRKRIEKFFRKSLSLDVVEYLETRMNSHSDTLYVTKKFTLLVLLKYILSIEETVYMNEKLKGRIEEAMHSIGFLSSISLVHLSCRSVEYVLVLYGHGIHIHNRIHMMPAESPDQILRTERKKVLSVIRKSVFFPKPEQIVNNNSEK